MLDLHYTIYVARKLDNDRARIISAIPPWRFNFHRHIEPFLPQAPDDPDIIAIPTGQDLDVGATIDPSAFNHVLFPNPTAL